MAVSEKTVLDQLVVEVRFTSVIEELHFNEDGFGPDIVEAFLLSIAKYRKDGVYSIPKYTNKPHQKLVLSEDERLTVTVEGF